MVMILTRKASGGVLENDWRCAGRLVRLGEERWISERTPGFYLDHRVAPEAIGDASSVSHRKAPVTVETRVGSHS